MTKPFKIEDLNAEELEIFRHGFFSGWWRATEVAEKRVAGLNDPRDRNCEKEYFAKAGRFSNITGPDEIAAQALAKEIK